MVAVEIIIKVVREDLLEKETQDNHNDPITVTKNLVKMVPPPPHINVFL